jgi:hypothetical protein
MKNRKRRIAVKVYTCSGLSPISHIQCETLRMLHIPLQAVILLKTTRDGAPDTSRLLIAFSHNYIVNNYI